MTRQREPPPSAPLPTLLVIDRLDVGPVKVEPDRIVAPYKVVQGDTVETAELSYRYEKPVFDPDDPGSLNLASMIVAQVALNYGLFCRTIAFHGAFDDVDRRFLATMAEHTAREIYVCKFLMPNQFLTGAAAELPVVERGPYLQAALEFPDDKPARAAAGWTIDARRVGIMASGGKDSLLTLGLLEDMGFEPHSVFLNESGRHWYTALNAHRHMQATRPDTTARVWTTSDRVFSFMLRRLPFLRKDYADIRSDSYPVRLWTVAVFLFGALPVLKQRGIGRIAIGDEYGTTTRQTYRGITHYEGVYDQTRYFDDEMSRYYRRKRWSLCQFSILRPMSELLIQTILVKRYPELQRQQMSCHAAHIKDGRVYPCGRCEKCHRIVGMLTALGADPTACGYDPERVKSCVQALPSRTLNHEPMETEHLAFLLRRQGVLVGDSIGPARARERPEMTRLRFHPQKSPPSWIPVDLRRPLFAILLEYADGAVERRGRVWSPIAPLQSPEFARPYPFDRQITTSGRALERTYLLAEMSWPQAKERFAETDTALLPVGAIEQHGPHLPLDVDAWDADYLARCVAERCTEPKPLVLPLIPYGVSYHHQEFPGTLSVSPETLSRMVRDVGMSAARHGITKLVIVNGHGGNAPTLQLAAQMLNRDAHIFACVDTGETSDHDIDKLVETPGDVHAGEIETSTCLATRPELVDMTKAESCIPRFATRYLDFSSTRSVDWYTHTGKLSPSGVLGDPTRASADKGRQIWELMIEHLREFVEVLKHTNLDDIYQRRL